MQHTFLHMHVFKFCKFSIDTRHTVHKVKCS